MDDFDELFSSEALRLLEGSDIDYGTILQPDELPVEREPFATAAPSEPYTNHNDPPSIHPTPGCSTLSFGPIAKPQRKRAKFDIKAREKVAAVRKKGACLRCRALKIPCSGSWPCTSCTHNKISCHGRESRHKWMDCVPYNLKDFDIYTLDFPCSQEQYDRILQTDNTILVGNAKHIFDSEVRWDLGSIASDCAEWVLDERMKPGSHSRVWILSSLKAENLLSTFVDGNLSKALRVLVETSSILHNWGMDTSYSQYSSSDLWRIRSFAGSQVLHGLERAMNLQRLANASADVLSALFLVLLGTVIAVGYSTSVSHSDERLEPPHMTANAFGDAQRQLLRILAHHMIYIAERAHVLDSQRANGHILENAYSGWSGKAVFEWKIVRTDGPEELDCDLDICASYSSVHDTQGLASVDFNGEQSTPDVKNIPTSQTPFLETSSPDNYVQRSFSRITGATDNLMRDKCFECGAYSYCTVGLQHPVCESCLRPDLEDPIDGISDYFGDPLPGLIFPDTQASAIAGSTPYLEDDWNWSDRPSFPAENRSFQTSRPSNEGGLYKPSSRLGRNGFSTPDRKYRRGREVLDEYNFKSECAVARFLELEVGEASGAVQINLPFGNDIVDHTDFLETPRRRRGVKAFTKRVLRKLLL